MNAALTFGISALIALAISAFITIGIIFLPRHFRMRTESRSHSPIDPIVFNHESHTMKKMEFPCRDSTHQNPSTFPTALDAFIFKDTTLLVQIRKDRHWSTLTKH